MVDSAVPQAENNENYDEIVQMDIESNDGIIQVNQVGQHLVRLSFKELDDVGNTKKTIKNIIFAKIQGNCISISFKKEIKAF